MFTPSVPLPEYGVQIKIVSLPDTWLRLSDQAQWDEAIRKLLYRIGLVCQKNIRAIMAGAQPGRDGRNIEFIHQTGRGAQNVQFQALDKHVDIYVDEEAAYLVYQEYGVKTQPMKWLVGKTIPLIKVQGQRVNPRTGRVIHGVSRVKFAGPGTPYAGGAKGQSAATPFVTDPGKSTRKTSGGRTSEVVGDEIFYRTITEASIGRPSKYNPTGLSWYHPGYSGKHFFRDGVIYGLEDASNNLEGLGFQVAGSAFEPELGTEFSGDSSHFTQEYQDMLDDLESQMTEFSVNR